MTRTSSDWKTLVLTAGAGTGSLRTLPLTFKTFKFGAALASWSKSSQDENKLSDRSSSTREGTSEESSPGTPCLPKWPILNGRDTEHLTFARKAEGHAGQVN